MGYKVTDKLLLASVGSLKQTIDKSGQTGIFHIFCPILGHGQNVCLCVHDCVITLYYEDPLKDFIQFDLDDNEAKVVE